MTDKDDSGARHDPEVERVERMNDSLRQSSQQTISQLRDYNSLYRAHLQEMGSRLEHARRLGQESAELKKSGEISVLKEELGSKSRYEWIQLSVYLCGGLFACLLACLPLVSTLILAYPRRIELFPSTVVLDIWSCTQN